MPGVPAGTSSIVSPSCFEPSRLVRAMSRIPRAWWALEIHVFCPLMRKPPPSWGAAKQVRPPTSEPAPGSLIAIASTCPSTIPPSTRAFCSSLAKRS